LKGCSREQQSSAGVESQQSLPSLAFEILDVLGLVENHVIPFLAPECKMVLDDELIRSDAYMERVLLAPAMTLEFAFLLRSEVRENLESGTPSFKLHFPVDDNRSRYDNQVRAPNTLVTSERSYHCNRLDGLAKAHLICENAIKTFVVQRNQPVQSNDLVFAKFAPQQERYLCLHLGTLESKAGRSECLSHFYCKFGHILHLHRGCYFILWRWFLGLLCCLGSGLVLVHTLLDKAMGLQLLCDFDTELEMLAHKIFKLFGPLLLSLAVYLHLVIVPDYLLNRLPVEHDDL